ncbi:unnamed protein product [Litomosoides sigmodontis]|uniref:EGF-like domain-containing protein n=1 Tax=Litomosoides sigmodontis TaxID=42156 RepID=A0A3P6TP09_LITSI|nr:unnamed protein product [Litomosoides sigmodontis]
MTDAAPFDSTCHHDYHCPQRQRRRGTLFASVLRTIIIPGHSTTLPYSVGKNKTYLSQRTSFPLNNTSLPRNNSQAFFTSDVIMGGIRMSNIASATNVILAIIVNVFQLITGKRVNFWLIKQAAKKIYAKTMRRATGQVNSSNCGKIHSGILCILISDEVLFLLLFAARDNRFKRSFNCFHCSIQQKRQIVTAMEKSNNSTGNFSDTKVMQWIQYEYAYFMHKRSDRITSTFTVEYSEYSGVGVDKASQCEIVLPCRDYTCFNGGICVDELILNDTDGELTYKAKCNCPPRNVYGVAARFEGERCERLTVVDNERIYDECFPCRKNAKNYASDCLDEYTQNTTLQYMNEVIKACGKPCESATRYCLNGGLCDVEGHLGDDNTTSYIIPVCQCVGLDEGILCEKHVNSPCDATTYDPRTPEEKCGEHGTCVGKTMHDYVCDCYGGWTGEKCDIREPCYNHACSPGSLCVSVPIEQREKYSLGYTCLCEINQDPDFTGSNNTVKCIQTNFGACTNHMCKNDGLCYPCEASDQNNLQLCSDEEKRRGFRCLCPHGLLPPFCDKEADACDRNKCLNGAECAVDPENEFNYICRCRIGFSGTFCEQQLSPCIMQGLQTCVMGSCKQDTSFVRGFRCECIDGYEGVNCDSAKRTDIVGFIRRNYWWTYPLTVGLVLTPTVIILIVLSEDRAKREYEYKLAEKQYLEKAKQREEKMDEEKRRTLETADTQTTSSTTQKSSTSTDGRNVSFRSLPVAATQLETLV